MRRTICGLVLVSEGGSRWHAEAAPHIKVERDDEFLTSCDGPHPTPDGGFHEGGEDHYYTRWGVYDESGSGSFAFGSSPGDFASFAEAAEWLAGKLLGR